MDRKFWNWQWILEVFSGPTGSLGTGPSGAQSGNNYFYFESSSGGLDTAYIISPVIDLTSVTSQAILYFYYHFYGSSGANLNVSVSSDLINFSNLATLSMLPDIDNLIHLL